MAKHSKRLSHPFLYHLAKTIFRPIAYFRYGYRYKDKYKIGKDEKLLILSNHQTDLDPLFLHLSLNKFTHCLATDTIFTSKGRTKFLRYLGTIPKRKGTTDVASVVEMMRVMNNGDSVTIFAEGNRSYAEFQFPIDEGLTKLAKKIKCNIMLFNIHGGFGKYPRIGNKPRKGKFYGEIKRILKYDEYKDMDDAELSKLIKDNLRVIDAESGNLYKSKRRAEYFERLFFICPKCGAVQSIYSKGSHIKCSKCDFDIEYTEDLKLRSLDPSIKYTKLVDWYDYQIDFIYKHDYSKDEIIFKDRINKMYIVIPFKDKKNLVRKKDLILTNKEVIVGKYIFPLSDIEIASPVSNRKLCFTINGENYVVRGNKKFNAIKYVLLFNVLDTKMKRGSTDIYYKARS